MIVVFGRALKCSKEMLGQEITMKVKKGRIKNHNESLKGKNEKLQS